MAVFPRAVPLHVALASCLESLLHARLRMDHMDARDLRAPRAPRRYWYFRAP
jgi:hypothetical protein